MASMWTLFSPQASAYTCRRGKPEEIIFRTSGKEARYISDLPLHRSQKIISSDGDSVTFSIFACPDESLVMELFRLSPRIEVLSPEDIRQEIARRAAGTLEIYAKQK